MTRLAAAWLATVATALLAAGLWVVGQAQYVEDYCHTRAPQPASPDTEGLSGRPGYLNGLVTIRCEYDHAPAIDVTDPLPLVGAVVLTVLVIAVAVGVHLWARKASETVPLADARG